MDAAILDITKSHEIQVWPSGITQDFVKSKVVKLTQAKKERLQGHGVPGKFGNHCSSPLYSIPLYLSPYVQIQGTGRVVEMGRWMVISSGIARGMQGCKL